MGHDKYPQGVKVPASFTVEPDLLERAYSAAERQGISASELFRRTLKQAVDFPDPSRELRKVLHKLDVTFGCAGALIGGNTRALLHLLREHNPKGFDFEAYLDSLEPIFESLNKVTSGRDLMADYRKVRRELGME